MANKGSGHVQPQINQRASYRWVVASCGSDGDGEKLVRVKVSDPSGMSIAAAEYDEVLQAQEAMEKINERGGTDQSNGTGEEAV